ncbi:MAG: hypothetical protein CM1200mP30_09150 [Pseudomonadota bacterium]|nr:MAG: hypothetical protein CM1200mP30_09150 [Pseudomonadota bacterium]
MINGSLYYHELRKYKLNFFGGLPDCENQWVLLKGDFYFYSPFTHLDMMFPSLFVKAPFQGKPTLYSPAYLSPLDQVNVP